MASKLAVAGIIEGSFTEEGLAAMSDVQDMTSQMAKELMQGIRDNVEDIATCFKKMAFVNPDRQARTIPPPKAEQEPVQTVPEEKPAAPSEPIMDFAMLEEITQQQKKKKSKKQAVDENQLSLFDFVA